MKRLGLVLACLLHFWIGHAEAQSLVLPGPGLPVSATPFSITHIADATTLTGGATCSLSINTGTAGTLLGIPINDLANVVTVTGVTVNGVNATQATNAATGDGGGENVDFWYLASSPGGTQTVVLSFSSPQTRCAISSYNIVGPGTPAFSAANHGSSTTGTSLSAGAVTVPSGGGSIIVFGVHSATPGTITPTNYSADTAGLVFGSSTVQFGHDVSNSGSVTYSAGWASSTDSSISEVSFIP
jgi:hypothetical protein